MFYSAGLVTSEALHWDETTGLAGATDGVWTGGECELPQAAPPPPAGAPPVCRLHDAGALCDALRRWHRCPELHKAIDGINYIAEQTRKEEESTRVRAFRYEKKWHFHFDLFNILPFPVIQVKEDWKYVAMVLDRLFLWIFTLAVVVGSAGIILQAPTLYDDRAPIDVRLSEIAYATAKPRPPPPPPPR